MVLFQTVETRLELVITMRATYIILLLIVNLLSMIVEFMIPRRAFFIYTTSLAEIKPSKVFDVFT